MQSSDKDIVISYIEAINSKNINKISELISEDHIFVDAYGDQYVGKITIQESWEKYFEIFPDYNVEITDFMENGAIFGLFGYVSATYRNLKNKSNSNFWRTPASWKAIVEDNKISYWQVYCDYTRLQRILDKK